MQRKCVWAAAALVAGLSSAALADIGDVYMFNLRSTPNELFRVSLSDPTNRIFIAQDIAYDTFAMDFDETASTLYAQNVTTGEFGIMDHTNGVFTPIGLLSGVAGTVTGFTVAPNGTAYISNATDLFTLDLATAVATPVGTMTGAQLVIDITADNQGRLYGHDIGLDVLVSIDAMTGAATTIGPTGLAANFAQGMDFDWSTNTLYATIYTGGGTGRFVSWDTGTGAVTTIVDTGAAGWNAELEMAVRSPIPAPGAAGVLAGIGLLALRRRR